MRNFSCFFLILLSGILNAQDLFVKDYQSLSNLYFDVHLKTLPNGESIMAGQSFAVGDSNKLFLIKLDKCGNQIWSKHIEHDRFLNFKATLTLIDLCIDSSQNIVIGGQYDKSSGSPRPFIMKFSQSGQLLFFTRYETSGNKNMLVYSTSIAANGDYLMYLLHDYTASPPNNDRMALLRTDQNGVVKFLKTYQFNFRSWGRMTATKDNGAIAKTGNSLFKLDSIGNIEWAKSFSPLGDLMPQIEVDSGFVFFQLFIGALDRATPFLIKHNGEVGWNGKVIYFFHPKRGIQRKNGNILFAGNSTFPLGNNAGFAEIDQANGSLIKLTDFGNAPDLAALTATSVSETIHGEVLFAGINSLGLLPRIAFGKLNDTLNIPSCPLDTSLGSNEDRLISFQSDINVPLGDVLVIPVNESAIIKDSLDPSEFPICSYTENKGTLNLGPDTAICTNQAIQIGQSGTNFDSYLWSTGETSKTITISQSGLYWLEVVSACDSFRDSILIDILVDSIVDLGNDTSACPGDSIVLSAKASLTNFLWSNGSTNNTLKVGASGTYWLETQTLCGTSRDSIEVTILSSIAKPKLEADTTICPKTELLLNPGILSNYNWNTGETSATITAVDSGWYWVSTGNSCEIFRDSIHIAYFSLPDINIELTPEPYVIGDTITLKNRTVNTTNSVWEINGQQILLGDTVYYILAQTGEHEIILNGTTQDFCEYKHPFSIQVPEGEVYMPNIFTPNGDGINDFYAPIGKEILSYTLEIYNRWGNLIFSETNIAWDGKHSNGLSLDDEEFIYTVEIVLINQKKLSFKGIGYKLK